MSRFRWVALLSGMALISGCGLIGGPKTVPADVPNRIIAYIIDAIIIPSPYASSFGGFVEWWTSFWFGAGGIFSSIWNSVARRREPQGAPSDMSSMSLLGGGLIAGEAITFLTLGIIGLLSLVR